MSDEFAVRYNAVEHTVLIMLQRLVFEIASMKGEKGTPWIEEFRNACVTEMNDARTSAETQVSQDIRTLSRSIVENVATMAKDRLAARRSEDGHP